MPVSLYYPHFQIIRIRTSHQHIHIIIGLQHHRIGLPGIIHRLIGDTSQICHNDKPAVFVIYSIADCLGGIVRYFKIPDLHTAYRSGSVVRKNPAAGCYMVRRK